MRAEALYLDSSALVKLVVHEAESEALFVELREWPRQTTSVVGEIELLRVARRLIRSANLELVLRRLAIVELDDVVRRLAAEVGSARLRSLDAIHLATALSLGDAAGGFCCYDARLAADAAAAGLAVVSPA